MDGVMGSDVLPREACLKIKRTPPREISEFSWPGDVDYYLILLKHGIVLRGPFRRAVFSHRAICPIICDR
jgi:hypothetical protein